MHATTRALLATIHDEQRARGEEAPPPATEEEGAALTDFVRRYAGVAPPAGYVAFLRLANGLDADGHTVHACGQRRRPNGTVHLGLPEVNRDFRDGGGPTGWLLLGETGDDLFAIDVRSGRAHALDRVSLNSLDEFDDADGLLHHVLRSGGRC